MADVVIRNVSKHFGRVHALKSVDLSVADGSFIALMGPSGCGKTTLLRAISGLELADGGTIAIGGEDVTAMPPEKRNIGLMFQSYALFPHMTVAQNLAFPMRMRRGYDAAERERRIKRALDLVRLPDVRDRYPRQMSGGQQQRVAFARALIDEPSVLLLDEPLSNLDARLRDDMQIELIELRRQVPITTILVTHDQTEGLTLADEIVVMRDGSIEQAGPPRAVYANPANSFVADFLGGANLAPVHSIRQEAGGWRAQTAEGETISVPAPQQHMDEGVLMIRQEDLRLLPRDEAAEVSSAARIAAVAYRGQSTQIAVDALGQRLRLHGAADISVSVGDTVRIGWRLADARLLPSG
ncbi:ABC transporter ATP-binding protein [Terrarubrum flagellatum]|uniref:ABC transporter ATP-binding protein n=1 Tax=Terrirubrum flagellatum TaxID=2895980 RepID=UPI0031456AF4